MTDVAHVAENLRRVREAVTEAAVRSGRSADAVRLVAVSKRHEEAAIRAAYAAGQRDFGENYVQEARAKAEAIDLPDLCWHYIGQLQSNKAKYVARFAHWCHSVDSAKLADELSHRCGVEGRTLQVLMQVNMVGEEQKGGASPEEAPELLEHMLALPNLEVQGLMTMPPFWSAERVRPIFARVAKLRDELAAQFDVTLPELSMGMSGDFEAAIAEGATMVRVGTAIFGARD